MTWSTWLLVHADDIKTGLAVLGFALTLGALVHMSRRIDRL